MDKGRYNGCLKSRIRDGTSIRSLKVPTPLSPSPPSPISNKKKVLLEFVICCVNWCKLEWLVVVSYFLPFLLIESMCINILLVQRTQFSLFILTILPTKFHFIKRFYQRWHNLAFAWLGWGRFLSSTSAIWQYWRMWIGNLSQSKGKSYPLLPP